MDPKLRHLMVCSIVLACAIASSDALATLSIDLSSEFMKIAIVKPGVPMEIVLNTESQRKTPVAVSIRNGERHFGEPALGTCVRSPKHCFVFFVDLLAKNSSHPLVKLFQERFPQYDLFDDLETGRLAFRLDDETKFSPEELLAMLIKHAKTLAEKFAEQPITEGLIAVPPFFTQAERQAVLYAAKLAGLGVLQLINDNTAAALNYGIFRTKEINSTMQYIMLYDMGSSSTTATVVGYHLTKVKDADGKAAETPQLIVKGVGYDRTLGGLEIDLRLRKFFVEKFLENSKKDAFKNPQALVKLLKEAARVKRVLSANTDHVAQIESLMDDVDFKTKISRNELEALAQDIFDRVPEVAKQALLNANISPEELQQVIIIGGGTRIPKVQERLLAALKRSDLGKSLNSDEAVALGAVYQAAHLSKGFRVKPFDILDSNILPIVVEFERGSNGTDAENPTETLTRILKRALYARSNSFPQGKVLKFPKHVSDFDFTVQYGDLDFLPPGEKSNAEKGFLMSVALNGVTNAFKTNEDKRSKGVKAHFKLDASGVLGLESAEAVFEYEKEEEIPSTIDKIGQSISNFFSASNTSETTDSQQNSTITESPSDEINAATGVETASNDTEKLSEDAGKIFTVTKVNKTVTVKEKLKFSVTRFDLADYKEKTFAETKKRLIAMDEKDRQKAERERARNVLETYIFDIQDKLYQPTYEKVSTEAEREDILTAFRAASEWLEEETAIQSADVYEKKLKGLKELMKNIAERVYELNKRPQVLEDLEKHLNTSRNFLELAQNTTVNDGLFTETEVSGLEKLIKETEEWRDSNVKAQEKASLTKEPTFRVSEVVEKIRSLDREVKYLLNKFRVPKTKPKEKTKSTKKSEKNSNATEETESHAANKDTTQAEEQAEYTVPSDNEIPKRDAEEFSDDSEKPAPEDSRTTHTPEL